VARRDKDPFSIRLELIGIAVGLLGLVATVVGILLETGSL
jgi:hypothetical protein